MTATDGNDGGGGGAGAGVDTTADDTGSITPVDDTSATWTKLGSDADDNCRARIDDVSGDAHELHGRSTIAREQLELIQALYRIDDIAEIVANALGTDAVSERTRLRTGEAPALLSILLVDATQHLLLRLI